MESKSVFFSFFPLLRMFVSCSCTSGNTVVLQVVSQSYTYCLKSFFGDKSVDVNPTLLLSFYILFKFGSLFFQWSCSMSWLGLVFG